MKFNNTMKVILKIDFWPRHGESLLVAYGRNEKPMQYLGQGCWEVEVDRVPSAKPFEYTYRAVSGSVIRREWRGHVLPAMGKDAPARVVVDDAWSDRPADAPFYTSAFTKAIFGRGSEAVIEGLKSKDANLLLKLAYPQVRPDEVLAICASGEKMGDWKKVWPMDNAGFPYWQLELKAEEPFMYKYVIADRKTLEIKLWEDGSNHFSGSVAGKDELHVIADVAPHFTARGYRGVGTAIPVFSLRSEEDFGVGEFYDLKQMVDWAAATGQGILQLLPINDTTMLHTWEDSYPYNANSTFALHPQFINLPAAGVRKSPAYKKLQAELNALEAVDYERVNREKLALLRKVYDKNSAAIEASAAYVEFMTCNEDWLRPYAVWCVLRDLNGTPDFQQWGKNAKYSKAKMKAVCEAYPAEVGFQCFLQYEAHIQLKEVVEYAHSRGVILKGDLPIGISRTSADAWIYPELFHMDSQAGAPPDAFSDMGQNWGFPTYNWERMAEDGFAWWKARLSKMSEYFDAFRIDHILGFFRIWEIPMTTKCGMLGYFNPALPYSKAELESRGFNISSGWYTKPASDKEYDVLFVEDPHKPGYYHPRISGNKTTQYANIGRELKCSFDELHDDFFYRRHNAFWKESAYRKLPDLLDSTSMLACGEDLGMIPDCVPSTMAELRILSLEIQRMPKAVGIDFDNPAHYPYFCVCTTSTHDMNPVRAWWKEDMGLTQKYWNNVLHRQGAVPAECPADACRQIVADHLNSPAMFTILPLQDWLGMSEELRKADAESERINEPANPRHYWRYRMHISLEELKAASSFNGLMVDMISASGR